MTDLVAIINERGPLLADGATGTNLFARGLEAGDAPELLNVDKPDVIKGLITEFVQAGSDLVLSNSFGGTAARLKLHNAQNRVYELNKIAAELAREAADTVDRDVIVAGSMGPTGELMIPLGEMSREQCVDYFQAQAEALRDGGADVLWLETLSAVEELDAAAEACNNANMPFCYTLSFDTNGGTMMGVTPTQLSSIADSLSFTPVGYGTNCGVGPSEVIGAIIMAKRANPNAILIAKANAGIPKFVDGEIQYNGTPELMRLYAAMVRDAGAHIIGGCCGSTPEHVASMRDGLDNIAPGDEPTVEAIESALGPLSDGMRKQLTGEAPDAPRRRTRRRG